MPYDDRPEPEIPLWAVLLTIVVMVGVMYLLFLDDPLGSVTGQG